MEKIALLIIYNHRYDKNIPILDKIYEGRFSYVYHVVPFYDGDRENVIAVYENSYVLFGHFTTPSIPYRILVIVFSPPP